MGTCTSIMSREMTTLVGKKLSREYGDEKWWGSVRLPNGRILGIPDDASRAVIYDPKDRSITTIGDELGDGHYGWIGGVLVNDRFIYACPEYERSMLKIDVQTGNIIRLQSPLPESNVRWCFGDVGNDGNVYFFPSNAGSILKVDTTNDTFSIVGNDMGIREYTKYVGAVKANNGCIYGIPRSTKQIVKFDPTNPDTTSMVGDKAEKNFECRGNGALGPDGNIYAVTRGCQILRINVANNTYSIVASAPQSIDNGWYGAIAGEDGNIYFPPCNASRVLMYDLASKEASFVGKDLGDGIYKWMGGATKSIDGIIYCMPYRADQILSIDTNPSA